jgi:hypothetical protein
MKPTGDKAGMINKAAASNPKSGHTAPAKGGVGNETKADMKGALEGSPTDMNPLRGAIQELGRQHPHKYNDHGPHHGTSDHIRHKPMKLV